LLAAINLHRLLDGAEPVTPPTTTMLGGLYRYLREAEPEHFQPMNANFGLLDPLAAKVRGGRKARRTALGERALADIETWAGEIMDRSAAEVA
jgi:methylenetetrahydrofolate--tRNA-(uracil-5-)-methyltransferase